MTVMHVRETVPESGSTIRLGQVWPASRTGMREQEFQFRAKLIHPPCPVNATTANNAVAMTHPPPTATFHRTVNEPSSSLAGHPRDAVAASRSTSSNNNCASYLQHSSYSSAAASASCSSRGDSTTTHTHRRQPQPRHAQQAPLGIYSNSVNNSAGDQWRSRTNNSNNNSYVGVSRSRANSLPVHFSAAPPISNTNYGLADARHAHLRQQQQRDNCVSAGFDSDSGGSEREEADCAISALNIIHEESGDGDGADCSFDSGCSDTVAGLNDGPATKPQSAPVSLADEPHAVTTAATTAAGLPKKYTRQEGVHFVRGDPHSERLAEFVANMVFVIFWHGSDEYVAMLHRRSPLAHCSADRFTCKASAEFISYTKYLLETMQISCSTALLSLYYLHLLRPRVKQLFVPGTFVAQPASGKAAAQSETRQSASHQYRRDPKLEYRLFTVALVLANKYLDDSSFMNKAWSDVTGLDLRKLNIMEQEFMKYIDYSLVVRENEYSVWVRWLESLIHSVLATSGANGAYNNSCSPPTRQTNAPHSDGRPRRRASIAVVTPSRDNMDVCRTESPVTPMHSRRNHQQLASLPTPSSSGGSGSSRKSFIDRNAPGGGWQSDPQRWTPAADVAVDPLCVRQPRTQAHQQPSDLRSGSNVMGGRGTDRSRVAATISPLYGMPKPPPTSRRYTLATNSSSLSTTYTSYPASCTSNQMVDMRHQQHSQQQYQHQLYDQHRGNSSVHSLYNNLTSWPSSATAANSRVQYPQHMLSQQASVQNQFYYHPSTTAATSAAVSAQAGLVVTGCAQSRAST